MPSDASKLLDLDNIVCLPDYGTSSPYSKMIIGYLSDVVGPVTMPMYTVTLYKAVSA